MGRTFASGVVLAAIVGLSVLLHGQSQSAQTPLAFEAVTIKENTTISDGGGGRFMPDGGIRMTHLPARSYLTMAFKLEPYQLVGTPDWMATTYYDVQAKPSQQVPRDDTFTMMQAMLRDRFQLRFHRESKELDGYALLTVKAGQFGPGLHRSSVDCEKASSSTPRCREGFIRSGAFKTVGSPLYTLVNVVMNQVKTPVLDRTQLSGTFDLDLHWSPDLGTTDDATSIFTALKEQLGLKLERTRVPSEMFVIDHVERPTPD
jgi:uncharacterized protein (TIGR03435 family)